MKRYLLALALLAVPIVVKAQPQDPNERITKLATLKYGDPQAIANLLRDFGVDTRVDSHMKVISLAGRRANVMTAEDAIKQLDQPSAAQKNIDLTVYFVVGTDQQPPASGNLNPIPQDLQSTVATLKSTFPFKNYGLLDVLSLRTRSGVSAHTTGQLGSKLTTFGVRSASVDGDGGMIRLENLNAGLRVPVNDGPNKINYVDTGIQTEVVDVKEGQKLVVGRSSLDGPDKALFLVLIAKIVN